MEKRAKRKGIRHLELGLIFEKYREIPFWENLNFRIVGDFPAFKAEKFI